MMQKLTNNKLLRKYKLSLKENLLRLNISIKSCEPMMKEYRITQYKFAYIIK